MANRPIQQVSFGLCLHPCHYRVTWTSSGAQQAQLRRILAPSDESSHSQVASVGPDFCVACSSHSTTPTANLGRKASSLSSVTPVTTSPCSDFGYVPISTP